MVPPRSTPGPHSPDGGDFVLIEDDEEREPEVELAQGSDVVDVSELERQLDAESLDAMLRRYIEDDEGGGESQG